MSSIYTRDAAILFQGLKEKFISMGVTAQIAEEEYNLNLILFRNNFNSFDGEDRLHIAMLVKEFMEKVRGIGIPIYMQVKEGDGRDKRP